MSGRRPPSHRAPEGSFLYERLVPIALVVLFLLFLVIALLALGIGLGLLGV